MKYLWTPYVCMLTAFGLCSQELWTKLFKWICAACYAFVLSAAVAMVIGLSLWRE
ncbi:hypothetical protein XELAEV_180322519mg, partial [Xenopus laevis]